MALTITSGILGYKLFTFKPPDKNCMYWFGTVLHLLMNALHESFHWHCAVLYAAIEACVTFSFPLHPGRIQRSWNGILLCQYFCCYCLLCKGKGHIDTSDIHLELSQACRVESLCVSYRYISYKYTMSASTQICAHLSGNANSASNRIFYQVVLVLA